MATRRANRAPAAGAGARSGNGATGNVRRVLIGVSVSLVLACSAVAVALEVLVDPDEVAAWVVPRASAALNRDVTVGDASLVLLPWPGARIADVRVENQAGLPGPPLLRAESLRVEVALLPLLFGSVRVRGVRATDLTLHLSVAEAGSSNFGDLVPEPRPATVSNRGPVRFALRKLTVSNGTVTYADARVARELELTGASAAARLSTDGLGGWRLVADASSDSLELRWLDGTRPSATSPGPSASWTFHGDLMFDRIQIAEGVLTHSGQTLEVEGRVTGLRGPSPALELTLSNDALDAAALQPWIPDGVHAALGPRPGRALELRGTAAVTGS